MRFVMLCLFFVGTLLLTGCSTMMYKGHKVDTLFNSPAPGEKERVDDLIQQEKQEKEEKEEERKAEVLKQKNSKILKQLKFNTTYKCTLYYEKFTMDMIQLFGGNIKNLKKAKIELGENTLLFEYPSDAAREYQFYQDYPDYMKFIGYDEWNNRNNYIEIMKTKFIKKSGVNLKWISNDGASYDFACVKDN